MNMIVVIAPILQTAYQAASQATVIAQSAMGLDEQSLLTQIQALLNSLSPEVGLTTQTIRLAESNVVESKDATLSPRESEVLSCVAKGLTQKEIARTLGLSPATIGGYKKEVYRKLGVSNAAEATLEAVRLGLT